MLGPIFGTLSSVLMMAEQVLLSIPIIGPIIWLITAPFTFITGFLIGFFGSITGLK